MWWSDGPDWGGMGAGGWVGVTLIMVAFWGLSVFGAVAYLRGRRRAGTRPGPGPIRASTAEQILDERLARGEISVEEYHARQGALRYRL